MFLHKFTEHISWIREIYFKGSSICAQAFMLIGEIIIVTLACSCIKLYNVTQVYFLDDRLL